MARSKPKAPKPGPDPVTARGFIPPTECNGHVHQHGLKAIPPGYIRYRHKGSPFGKDKVWVALLISTADGYSTSGPRVPLDAEWAVPKDEHGSIVAYQRVVDNRPRLSGSPPAP